ncbi:MAG: hypothetical protein LJE64_08320 [Desulfofustis sp.]|jgi:hypothetical protein|nr:hypothetical protein [Desulfofustis sp.]
MQNLTDKRGSLERIRDMIIEAYAQVDRSMRDKLLAQADRLQQQLLMEYKSKGLKLTADNIDHTLETHKKRQCERSR